jgi:hypothetical protein
MDYFDYLGLADSPICQNNADCENEGLFYGRGAQLKSHGGPNNFF